MTMSHSIAVTSDDQDERNAESAPGCPPVDQEWAVNLRHTSGRSLRKSCDRCHQQKLRCAGSKTSLVPCLRCRRAGVECVYSARSSKQPSKNSSETMDHARPGPVTPAPSHHSGVFETIGGDMLQFDEFFPSIPSPWEAMDIPPLIDHVLAPIQGADTSTSSTTTGSTFSGNSGLGEAAFSTADGAADLSARLANVCQALEGMLRKVTRDQPNRDTLQYPVGEVFSAFDAFLRLLTLDHMRSKPQFQAAQTPFDVYMDCKQGSMAAQCYILCLKLMVSLSEKMLQSLLASPLPTQRFSFNFGGSETTPLASGLGGADVDFMFPSHSMIGHFELDDLYAVPSDSFDHTLNSTVNVLRMGAKLLGRMEQLLEIPPEMAAGTMPIANPDEPPRSDQQRRRSLPARLVTSTWEYETSIGHKCAVTYFKRCRAAILGLAQSHR